MKKVLKFIQIIEGLLIGKSKKPSIVTELMSTGNEEFDLGNYVKIVKHFQEIYKKYGVRDGTVIEVELDGEWYFASLEDDYLLLSSSKKNTPRITCFEDAGLLRVIEIKEEDSTIEVRLP